MEDNKDLCQLIKLQLEDKFNIHIANNGVEGLKKVHLYHHDIVVTDQMMPEMDGLEMLQSIRKDFQISHIPVIILTAKNDEGAKTKAITLGANAYITKPFSKEYLLARIISCYLSGCSSGNGFACKWRIRKQRRKIVMSNIL